MKGDLLPSPPLEAAYQQAQKDRIFRKRLLICVLFLFSIFGLPTIVDRVRQRMVEAANDKPHIQVYNYEWPDVPSRRFLEYYPCYRDAGDVEFECARLSVPLDHFNGSTTAEISLAIIRLPASVTPEDPRYGGAILFNPGGPGGSGVGFLRRAWQSLDAAIHKGESRDDTRFYDFISFDPRGVALSDPPLECFNSNLMSWTWALRELQEGVLGSSNAAFGRLWSMSAAMGGSCSISKGTEDIKQFVSTASVAADMGKIVEAHGYWREDQIQHSKARQGALYHPPWQYDPSKEKINYWGFSYGTYLGMTFAAMFPDRIERFIIDGVVDAYDYTKALWFDNLVDTEKEMDSFYEYCAEAGYPACAIANKRGKTTPTEVKERTAKVIDSLYHNPLPIITDEPDIISYSDVRNLVFASLYKPLLSFPLMANVFAELETGNGTQMAAIMKPFHQPTCSMDDRDEQRKRLQASLSSEASMAIACSDGDPQDHFTKEQFKTHLERMVKQSPTIGPQWAAYRLRCVHYNVRPKHRYPGPWRGNTSYPILLIGNSADPVTPVQHARKMAKGYQDARVLEVGGSGHCSISTPSKCARKAIYQYFQHGRLPEDGAFCKVDEFPFNVKPDVSRQTQGELHRYIESAPGLLMPRF